MNTMTKVMCGALTALFAVVGCSSSPTSTTDGGTASEGGTAQDGATVPLGTLGPAELKDNGDETLSDSKNGLDWEKAGATGAWTMSNFNRRCDKLSLGGKTGWRPPTVDELRTLIVNCPSTTIGGSCPASSTCIESGCAKGTGCTGCPKLDAGSGCYMSPLFGSCASHWAKGIVVDFDTAKVWSTIDQTNPGRLLRCVRSR